MTFLCSLNFMISSLFLFRRIFIWFLTSLVLIFCCERRFIYNLKQRLNFNLIIGYVRQFCLHVLIFGPILFLLVPWIIRKILSVWFLINPRIIISLIVTIEMRSFCVFLRCFYKCIGFFGNIILILSLMLNIMTILKIVFRISVLIIIHIWVAWLNKNIILVLVIWDKRFTFHFNSNFNYL